MRSLLLVAVAVIGIVLFMRGETTPPTPSSGPAPTVPGCAAPLRFVVFQDKTDSGNWNRTPQISAGDLEPIVERATVCGGQVAVGLVGADSNRPLVRLHVDAPPSPPQEPDLEGNPFFAAEALEAYEKEREAYEAAAATHQRRVRSETERFLQQAGELLASAPDQMRTDVWGAVDRGAYVFGEPTDGWALSPQDVLVLITDAEDNVATERVPLPGGVSVYLVNGNPVLGPLEGLNPIRVEAFDAVVRAVLR